MGIQLKLCDLQDKLAKILLIECPRQIVMIGHNIINDDAETNSNLEVSIYYAHKMPVIEDAILEIHKVFRERFNKIKVTVEEIDIDDFNNGIYPHVPIVFFRKSQFSGYQNGY